MRRCGTRISVAAFLLVGGMGLQCAAQAPSGGGQQRQRTSAQGEWVRWERFGELRENGKLYATFLFSALLVRHADEDDAPKLLAGTASEPPKAVEFNRLLLEITHGEGQPPKRVAYYFLHPPFPLDDANASLPAMLWLFVDCEEGHWILLRERPGDGKGGSEKQVQLEVPGWRSAWFAKSVAKAADSPLRQAREVAPETMQFLLWLSTVLPSPDESLGYPLDISRALMWLAGDFLGLSLGPWKEKLASKVLETRVARGRQMAEPLKPEFEKRFGRWASWQELPVKTLPFP